MKVFLKEPPSLRDRSCLVSFYTEADTALISHLNNLSFSAIRPYIFFKFRMFCDNYTRLPLSFFVVLTSKIREQTLFMGINTKVYESDVKCSGQLH